MGYPDPYQAQLRAGDPGNEAPAAGAPPQADDDAAGELDALARKEREARVILARRGLDPRARLVRAQRDLDRLETKLEAIGRREVDAPAGGGAVMMVWPR